MNPHAHIRSLPREGAVASVEAGRQERMSPHAHFGSLPPKGAVASFGAARQEAT